MTNSSNSDKEYDLICVGGGIMSSTLALLSKLLNPDIKIAIYERLGKAGQESSNAWNNAGTAHSGFCELNYTPERKDGTIDIEKAVNTLSQFERSKEFWAYLVKQGWVNNPTSFIQSCPHHSWVQGEDNVRFLKKRYETMKKTFMFQSMQFSDDPKKMAEWIPLIMKNRDPEEKTAATRVELGAEANYGVLTNTYFSILEKEFNTKVQFNTAIKNIEKSGAERWTVKGTTDGTSFSARTKRVFIGAGGDALLLLQKAGIKEGKGYGGFPVSGEFLFCKNPKVIEQHHAKVYSKAGPDAPPMSTPHLDTRYIDGKQELLFGPFAGFTPKFLKTGSNIDLFRSIKWSNLKSMLGAFWHNLELSKYLIGQLTMSHKDRMKDLREFVKDAKDEDWELVVAGQRVQIIKKDEKQWGKLQFGTEVVHNEEGSITALLGASPGASTAVHIMLDVLRFAFKEEMDSDFWRNKLEEMIPFWDKNVDEDKEQFLAVQKECAKLLKLEVEL